MSRMFNPPHPGDILKDGVMIVGVTVTGLARQLGVTRVALPRVLNAAGFLRTWPSSSPVFSADQRNPGATCSLTTIYGKLNVS